MDSFRTHVEQASDFIEKRAGKPADVAILAGTGLGRTLDGMRLDGGFDYAEIPHFPVSTVAGHQGRLSFGELSGKRVWALSGRFHLYEGYSVLDITFAVRVLRLLGVRTFVMASATGGLNPDFSAGDIMLVRDHINLTGRNPLVGKNIDDWGPRFPEMHEPYDRRLAELACQSARETGVPLREGVYVGLTGPSLETPAEMTFLRAIGADVVGFSTVNETIAAVHAGMRVLAFAVVTNMNVPGRLTPSSLETIIAVADRTAPKVLSIVSRALPKF
ncbi:MAG: purine-nucleoside phosphorylase [Thermodesulfobacteriota bacterium]